MFFLIWVLDGCFELRNGDLRPYDFAELRLNGFKIDFRNRAKNVSKNENLNGKKKKIGTIKQVSFKTTKVQQKLLVLNKIKLKQNLGFHRALVIVYQKNALLANQKYKKRKCNNLLL